VVIDPSLSGLLLNAAQAQKRVVIQEKMSDLPGPMRPGSMVIVLGPLPNTVKTGKAH
jgi:hypothetical protein